MPKSKSNKTKNLQLTIRAPTPTPTRLNVKRNGNPKRRSRARRLVGRSKHPLGLRGGVAYWVDALLSPNPSTSVPKPRAYADGKIAMAVTRTYGNIQTTAYNNVSFIMVDSAYGGSTYYKNDVVNGITAIGTLTGAGAPQSNSIAAASIEDCNLQACVMNIKYTGAPLSAQGTILVGTVPDNGTSSVDTASYQSLRMVAGVQEFSTVELMKHGYMSVAMTKVSPDAESFLAVGTTLPDVNMPFVAINGFAAGLGIIIDVLCVYECRIKANLATGLYPFSSPSNESKTTEENYLDAIDYISKMPSTSYWRDSPFGEYLASYAPATLAVLGTAAAYGNAVMQANRGNRPLLPI